VEPPDVAAQGVLIPDSKNMFSMNFPRPTLSQTARRKTKVDSNDRTSGKVRWESPDPHTFKLLAPGYGSAFGRRIRIRIHVFNFFSSSMEKVTF
jgi:hypothetical protein